MGDKAGSNNFISKFYSILKNKKYSSLIKYDESSAKIEILEKERFVNEIIPNFFRQTSFASFMRQMNIYGFTKLKRKQEICFTHPKLQHGEKFLSIRAKKRKNQKTNNSEARSQVQVNHEQLHQGSKADQNIGSSKPSNFPLLNFPYSINLQGTFMDPQNVNYFVPNSHLQYISFQTINYDKHFQNSHIYGGFYQ